MDYENKGGKDEEDDDNNDDNIDDNNDDGKVVLTRPAAVDSVGVMLLRRQRQR